MLVNKNYSIKEACDELSIPQKYLENYIKAGKELKLIRIGRRKFIPYSEVDSWRRQREFGVCRLTKRDYLQCLEFAIRSFYAYASTSEFGTAQQRDAGKFITNFVIGKLGELAVLYFLKRNFAVDIKLDFDLRDAVVGQDITEIAKPRRGRRVYNPLKLRVAVKASKMKNVWLIVPQKETTDKMRRSDVYIFTRVDVPLDHLLRILREQKSLRRLAKIIPPFTTIDAEVCGFIYRKKLLRKGVFEELPEPKQAIQPSYIARTGILHKQKKDWNHLLKKL